MELGYDPLWDEQGRLRQGCTVGEALAWMTKFGGRTPGESVCINGVGYKIGRLLYGPERPAVADKPISRVYDGYYRQLNFSVYAPRQGGRRKRGAWPFGPGVSFFIPGKA